MSSMDNDNAHCLILSRCLAVSYGFLSWHDMAKYIACIVLLCSRKSHEPLKLGYKYVTNLGCVGGQYHTNNEQTQSDECII